METQDRQEGPDLEGLEFEIDLRIADIWSALPEMGEEAARVVGAAMRASFAQGYLDSKNEGGEMGWAVALGYEA